MIVKYGDFSRRVMERRFKSYTYEYLRSEYLKVSSVFISKDVLFHIKRKNNP